MHIHEQLVLMTLGLDLGFFSYVDFNLAHCLLSGLAFTAYSELRKVLFLVLSVCDFFFVNEISWEPLNGFAPHSHGRYVWSLAQLRFQAGGRRRRPNLGLVCFVLMFSVFLVKDACLFSSCRFSFSLVMR